MDAEWALELLGGAAGARPHYRKGLALRELGLLEESLDALELGLQVDPASKQVREEVLVARELIRQRFQAGRAGEVEAARRELDARRGERLAREGLEAEEDWRVRMERRQGLERHRLGLEEQQR